MNLRTVKLDARDGFTLFETLIYIALLALILSFFAFTFHSLSLTGRQTWARLEAETESRFLVGRVESLLSGATDVDQPAVGATSSVLEVDGYIFDLVDGVARLERPGEPPVELTSGAVRLDSLVFEHIAASGSRPATVNINVAITSLIPNLPQPVTSDLSNTIYLRQ